MELSKEVQVWIAMQARPDHVEAPFTSATVETGAVCNLRCPFCPTGNGDLKLSQELITLETFRAALDALGPAVKALTLFNWGEPLAHPKLAELIAEAAGRGMHVMVSTNLSLRDLDDAAAERLVTSGLGKLTVSCDGASQETYEKYRVGGSFQRVMENMRRIQAAKRRLGRAKPVVIWQMLLHRGNEHEAREAARLAGELGVALWLRDLYVPEEHRAEWAMTPDGRRRAEETARAMEAGPAPAKLEPSKRKAVAPSEDLPLEQVCLQAWDSPVIQADGSVLPCCLVHDPAYSLGNLKDAPLGELWNGPLAKSMRRYLRTGVDDGSKIPCRGCPHDPHRLKA